MVASSKLYPALWSVINDQRLDEYVPFPRSLDALATQQNGLQSLVPANHNLMLN